MVGGGAHTDWSGSADGAGAQTERERRRSAGGAELRKECERNSLVVHETLLQTPEVHSNSYG